MLVLAVAIPASGGQSARGFSEETAGVPVGNGLADLWREIGAAVYNPAHGARKWWRRHDACSDRRVGACTADNIFDGWPGGLELDVICKGTLSDAFPSVSGSIFGRTQDEHAQRHKVDGDVLVLGHVDVEESVEKGLEREHDCRAGAFALHPGCAFWRSLVHEWRV